MKLTTIEELLTSKRIKPVYLPSYIPELNLTELCFNLMRQQIEKNEPRTFEELKLAIDEVVDMLNQKDLTEYFRHCSTYDFSEKSDQLIERVIELTFGISLKGS